MGDGHMLSADTAPAERASAGRKERTASHGSSGSDAGKPPSRRGSSPGRKANPFAKALDKVGGLFSKGRARRLSNASEWSQNSASSASAISDRRQSMQADRDRGATDRAIAALAAELDAVSQAATPEAAPQPAQQPAPQPAGHPPALRIPTIAVDDHASDDFHPNGLRSPDLEMRISAEPAEDDSGSEASWNEELEDPDSPGSGPAADKRGRRRRSSIAPQNPLNRIGDWMRRFSVSPAAGPHAPRGVPRTFTEPGNHAGEAHAGGMQTLPLPPIMHRSRSVDDGDDYSRGGTATEPRPRSEKGLTFQEDGAHKKKRKEKDKEGEGVERRRSSVFSFLSGGGSATSEDDNKSAGSLFSFGRRRTRTEGSISIAAASPFAEVPLPPLLLAGRYKDARQVLDHATAEAVRRHLPRRLREAVRWPLLYSMDMHGTSFSSFYLLVENKGPTVWAIEDEKGVLFGAFVSEDVRVVPDGRGFYGTGETFLWERLTTKPASSRGVSPAREYATMPAHGHAKSPALEPLRAATIHAVHQHPAPGGSPSLAPNLLHASTAPAGGRSPAAGPGASPRVRFGDEPEDEMPDMKLPSSFDDEPPVATRVGTDPPPLKPAGILARSDTVASAAGTQPFRAFSRSESEPGVGQVRMHQAAGLAGESFFVSTRRDCIVFGGGAAHVGLYLDRDFDGGYSDGRCTTFELEGTPLGSEAEDFAGFLGGRADFLVHTGGDENHLRQFTVRGIEVWGIDENFVRRSTDVPPEEITSDEARAMGLGFGRWVEGDDKFGEMKD